MLNKIMLIKVSKDSGHIHATKTVVNNKGCEPTVEGGGITYDLVLQHSLAQLWAGKL